MSVRRKHSKISEFPTELKDAVHKLLQNGVTYEDVTSWINDKSKETGTKISKSAVGRYGKDFMARLDRLKIVTEQAKVIIQHDPNAPDTEMMSAANKIALSLITETLMKVQEGDLDQEKLTDVFKSLAQLQRASVGSEKLRLDYQRKVQAAAGEIEKAAKMKGLDQETLQFIKEQVYGIVSK